jgi:hypothetical protein
MNAREERASVQKAHVLHMSQYIQYTDRRCLTWVDPYACEQCIVVTLGSRIVLEALEVSSLTDIVKLNFCVVLG